MKELRIVALTFALILSGAAAAQWRDPALTIGPRSTPHIATVSKDGEVTINWEQAEKTVASPASVDATTLAIARLMIAIRDGTWKAGEAK